MPADIQEATIYADDSLQREIEWCALRLKHLLEQAQQHSYTFGSSGTPGTTSIHISLVEHGHGHPPQEDIDESHLVADNELNWMVTTWSSEEESA